MTDREVAEINVLRAVVRQADGINVLQAKLDAVTAERDALQAKLDAVPVAAIQRWYSNSDPTVMNYEYIADIEADATALEAWLKSVTP